LFVSDTLSRKKSGSKESRSVEDIAWPNDSALLLHLQSDNQHSWGCRGHPIPRIDINKENKKHTPIQENSGLVISWLYFFKVA
jgi:hypothetical protein